MRLLFRDIWHSMKDFQLGLLALSCVIVLGRCVAVHLFLLLARAGLTVVAFISASNEEPSSALVQLLTAQPNTQYLVKQVVPPEYDAADVWGRWKPTEKRPQLQIASKDVFQAMPGELDSRYRNPCWKDEETKRFRCLPYYQILGVSKCGTTDMYSRMQRHADIVRGSKGPHFWDECPYPSAYAYMCSAPPNGTFNDYLDLFDDAAKYIHAHPDAITGEASSNTFTGVLTFIRGELSRLNVKVNVTLADLLREVVPYSRFIVLFRNPVDRYYSAFQYYRNEDQPLGTAAEFHAKTVEDIGAWKQCLTQKELRVCLKEYRPMQLVKGMYSEFVEDWTSVFPRSQLLFIRYEDYKVAVKEHLWAVFRFLGLKDPSEDDWGRVLALEVRNQRSNLYPPMQNNTRHMLHEFYQPFNKKLAQLLEDERYLWNRRRH